MLSLSLCYVALYLVPICLKCFHKETAPALQSFFVTLTLHPVMLQAGTCHHLLASVCWPRPSLTTRSCSLILCHWAPSQTLTQSWSGRRTGENEKLMPGRWDMGDGTREPTGETWVMGEYGAWKLLWERWDMGLVTGRWDMRDGGLTEAEQMMGT